MAESRKEYELAVVELNNFMKIEHLGNLNEKTKKVDIIHNCLERIGLQITDINHKLSVIHIAGARGKGLTCEYAQSILRVHGLKTGSFRSPHLVHVRERIRINGNPVSEEIFCRAFWHVSGKLNETKESNGGLMPGYFAAILLMAFYIFLKQEVDVVLLEAGIGGEYDATNFIQKPKVCAIARDVDKPDAAEFGIMKEGFPMVTVPQRLSKVKDVLKKKAEETRCLLSPPAVPFKDEFGRSLRMEGEFQLRTAALAVQVSRIFLKTREQGAEGQNADLQSIVSQPVDANLTEEERKGLKEMKIHGRRMIVKRGDVTYYLDGTRETKECASWFKEEADKEENELGANVYRSLLFGLKKPFLASAYKPSHHMPDLLDLGFKRAAFFPHVISTSAREKFPDSMEFRFTPEEAKEYAAFQLKEWEEVRDKCDHNLPSCVSKCFPSTASALWWVGLEKDTEPTQPPLKEMAEEDLREENVQSQADQGVGEGGAEAPEDPGAVSGAHVQVLVTGSLVMLGRVMTIIKPDFWGQ